MTLDLPAIKQAADLEGIVSQACGPGRNGKFLCCFHDDTRPSLEIRKDQQSWKCWSCGKGGSAIDFIAEREGISFAEAARMLAESLGMGESPRDRARRPSNAPKASKPVRPPAYFDPAWQSAVDGLVCVAEENLAHPDARPVRRWLADRGFDKAACSMFRFGFLPAPWRSAEVVAVVGKRLFAPRGVVIPWCSPGGWYSNTVHPNPVENLSTPRWCGVNIRQLHDDPSKAWEGEDKYRCVAGSSRGLPYPFAELLSSQGTAAAALLLEGEFDAALAHMMIGHKCHCLTIGGSTQSPSPEAMAFLSRCSRVLVATDADAAGDTAALAWLARFPSKSTRARVPIGKDFGEFVQAGGNPTAWVDDLLRQVETAVAAD